MSIANPADDRTTIIDHTALAIGNLVQSLDDDRNGRVIEINFGSATQVFVRWDDSTMSTASVLRLRRV